MATFVRVTSDGSLRSIPLPFTSHSGGQDVSVTAITGSIPSWGLSGNLVVFSSNVPRDTVVQVARKTAATLRYKFSQGAAFTAGNLDYDLQQLLYIGEEARDLASAGIIGNLNMQGNRIVNLAGPQELSDAATKQYVDQAVVQLQGQDYSNTIRALETRVTVNEGRIYSNTSRLDGLTSRVTTLEGIQSPLPNGFFQNGKINPDYLPQQQNQGGGGGGGQPQVPVYGGDAILKYVQRDTRPDGYRQDSYSITPADNVSTKIAGIHMPLSDSVWYSIEHVESNDQARSAAGRLVYLKELTGVKTELATETSSLRARVRALEQGGSSGGGGSGGQGLYIDGTGVARIDNAILRGIRQPEYETDAVNLKFFQEALATEHEVLAEQATTQARAVAVEIRDRILAAERTVDTLSASVEALKNAGGVQPSPQPSPSPTPAGGSGISMGITALPRAAAHAFVNGVPKPSMGVTGNNTNYAFTLTPGLWEFRVHAKGGNVANVSFAGSGTITTSFAEYTIHTVQNCSQVTVTLPNPGTWTFGISGVYLGAQVG